MWWALIRKELREIAPYAAVGWVLYALVVLQAIYSILPTVQGFYIDIGIPGMGYSQSPSTFPLSLFLSFIALGRDSVPPHANYMLQVILNSIALPYVAVLALRQTVGEEIKKTYSPLLHFPAPRFSPLICKLLVGCGAFLVPTLLVIGILVGYSAIPGHYPFPFIWMVSLDPLRVPFIGVILYLSVFLVGIRQARWYGARALPVLFAYVVCNSILFFSSLVIALPLSLVLILLIVAAIVAEIYRRDYR